MIEFRIVEQGVHIRIKGVVENSIPVIVDKDFKNTESAEEWLEENHFEYYHKYKAWIRKSNYDFTY